MYRLALLILLLGGALGAQENRIDLALAYPSTTMVYFQLDDDKLAENFNLADLLNTLSRDELQSIQELLLRSLGLELEPAELDALMRGNRRSSIGLLDVTLSGPRLQLVMEHADPAPLARALTRAHAEGARIVPEIKDHFGTPVYAVNIVPTAQEIQPGGFRMNPLESWLNQEQIFLALVDNRYIVAANGFTAVTDAVDFLAFPEDIIDTLLSSARYHEAVREYEAPHGVLYVSIESIITAVERLSGDRGSSPVMRGLGEMLGGGGGTGEFVVRLLQYEQFKSASAAIWFDGPRALTRIDMAFSFHNAPGWFEALRVEPGRRPLEDMIPVDALLATTECFKDRAVLYERLKRFVFERARNAGQQAIIDGWQEWEDSTFSDGMSMSELLEQVSGGQATILLPLTDDERNIMPFAPVWLIELDDLAASEQFLFERFLPSKPGEALRSSQGELGRVTVYEGVEIHHGSDESAYALIPRGEGSGVFAMGDAGAIRRVMDAYASGNVIGALDTFKLAESKLPEVSSFGWYINAGSLLGMIADAFQEMSRWTWLDDEEDDFDRDDTEADANPAAYLAEFLGKTVIVGSAHSEPRAMRYRFVVAGIPGDAQLEHAAIHFRDVNRNSRVRDDLLKVRDAAFAHFVLQGEPASDIQALLAHGYLAETAAQDPYSEDERNTYVLATVPPELDSRQAVLLAYQRQPGLRGKHLAVLWNSHIVTLTPADLEDAITRAKEGQALAEGRYSTPEPTLFSLDLESGSVSIAEERESPEPELVIIDDDGKEEAIAIGGENLRERAEQILDEREAAAREE